ncbi:hypothetical protein MKW92_006733 [Papaver armeniacum]|nr:hypothetical protein MKW92_006733 [Papaver armeniacum]
MENHHPSTLLSMDSCGASHEDFDLEMNRHTQNILSRPRILIFHCQPNVHLHNHGTLIRIHLMAQFGSSNLQDQSLLHRHEWAFKTGGASISFSVDKGFVRSHRIDFGSWRNLQIPQFELERPPCTKGHHLTNPNAKRLLNGSGLICQLKYQIMLMVMEWIFHLSATKEKRYLIIISMPFMDLQRVKVTWRNTLTHGIVKISSVITAYAIHQGMTGHLRDTSFLLNSEDANLEHTMMMTELCFGIMVPKHHEGSEEHEGSCMPAPHLEPMTCF